MSEKKVPILKKLLEDGVFETEKEARAYLMAGEVFLGEVRLQGGMKVPRDAQIRVRGREVPFAGKGGFKLTGALRDFSLSPRDRVCIDAGASTGGFTDCLVQNGARLVYAVDVGFGQLIGRLRQDPRVVNCERTNISDEKLLSLSPRPTFGTVDVSYLSLRRAVPYFQQILHGEGDLCCLVKPLFEIDDPEARRTGVIPEDRYQPLLRDLIADLDALPGVTCIQVTNSPVTGNAGTREFFLHLALGQVQASPPERLEREILEAVDRAEKLEKYRKT